MEDGFYQFCIVPPYSTHNRAHLFAALKGSIELYGYGGGAYFGRKVEIALPTAQCIRTAQYSQFHHTKLYYLLIYFRSKWEKAVCYSEFLALYESMPKGILDIMPPLRK